MVEFGLNKPKEIEPFQIDLITIFNYHHITLFQVRRLLMNYYLHLLKDLDWHSFFDY